MCYAERVGKHGVREGRPCVVARRRQSVGGQELVVAGGKLYRAGERRTVEAHRAERDVLHVDIVRAGVSERQNAESAGVVNRAAPRRRLRRSGDELQVAGRRIGNSRFFGACGGNGESRKYEQIVNFFHVLFF